MKGIIIKRTSCAEELTEWTYLKIYVKDTQSEKSMIILINLNLEIMKALDKS